MPAFVRKSLETDKKRKPFEAQTQKTARADTVQIRHSGPRHFAIRRAFGIREPASVRPMYGLGTEAGGDGVAGAHGPGARADGLVREFSRGIGSGWRCTGVPARTFGSAARRAVHRARRPRHRAASETFAHALAGGRTIVIFDAPIARGAGAGHPCGSAGARAPGAFRRSQRGDVGGYRMAVPALREA